MLKIRAIKCGKKGCKKCPHGWYVYAQWKEKGNVKEKYLGKLGEEQTEAAVQELAQTKPKVAEEWRNKTEKIRLEQQQPL